MDEDESKIEQGDELYPGGSGQLTSEAGLGQPEDQTLYQTEDEGGMEYGPPPPPISPIEHILGIGKRFLVPFILVTIAVVLIILFLRFIRGGPQVLDKEVNLVYWTLWEDESTFQPLIESFTKEQPKVTVTILKQTPREYRERLENTILKGEGPDIFRFHNSWLPMFTKKDLIAPLPEKTFSSKEFESTFYPVVTNDLKVGDSFYGVPLTFDSLGLFYNKRILQAAGVSPPTSWEELKKVANELTVRDTNGRIITSGIALGTTNNVEFWSDILGMMIFQNSGSITDPKGANVEDALLFYTQFGQQPDNVWDATLDNSTLAFAGEKVAMIFAPSWAVLEVLAMNPNLDFAIAPVPQLSGVNVAWATYWVEGVNSKSKNKDQAFAFLAFLNERDNMVRLYSEQAKTRLIGEPYSRTDLAETLKGNPYLDTIVSQGPYARSGYLSARTFDNGLNDRIIKYYEDAVNGVHQGKSPRAALETVSRGIAQVLGDFGLSNSP